MFPDRLQGYRRNFSHWRAPFPLPNTDTEDLQNEIFCRNMIKLWPDRNRTPESDRYRLRPLGHTGFPKNKIGNTNRLADREAIAGRPCLNGHGSSTSPRHSSSFRRTREICSNKGCAIRVNAKNQLPTRTQLLSAVL
ncbi:unnamed protein product, partial [Nesidiocoris tenuis]